MKEVQKVLDELEQVRPEQLTGEAKRLFEAIMKIADERDELLKEKQADKEKIKELESDKEIKNKIIDRMAEYINKLDIDEDICTKNIINPELCNEQYSNCKECIKQYFENLAKESGEIDDI